MSEKQQYMIETKRLLLRPFSMSDIDLVRSLYCNEELLRYTPFDVMTNERAKEHLVKIVQDWEKDPLQSLEFVMIKKPETPHESDEEKVGRCHILIDSDTDTGMIGWIFCREYHGRHYARESGEALIRHCFDVLGLHRVNAVCHPENHASRRVLEQCRMRLEAHYMQKCRYTKNGIISWEDELEYARLSSEKAVNPAFWEDND